MSPEDKLKMQIMLDDLHSAEVIMSDESPTWRQNTTNAGWATPASEIPYGSIPDSDYQKYYNEVLGPSLLNTFEDSDSFSSEILKGLDKAKKNPQKYKPQLKSPNGIRPS